MAGQSPLPNWPAISRAIEWPAMSAIPDNLRGYEFLPGQLIETTPRLYETEETELDDKLVTMKFFCPVFNWFVFEVDQNGERAFGYIENLSWPGGSELGYIDITELRELLMPAVAGRPVIYVDRDLDWTPKPFKEIAISDR